MVVIKEATESRMVPMMKGKKFVLTIVDLSMISHDLKASGQVPVRAFPVLLY